MRPLAETRGGFRGGHAPARRASDRASARHGRREKLATIYAERYERLDLAADQLNQLVESPNHPPKEIARWLNLLADLQIKFGADYEVIRETLQRIIDRFPGLAPAELAQQRIEHLKLELKGKERGHVVKLGTYEQNIGLKGRKSPTV
jgi:hypothetical protein